MKSKKSKKIFIFVLSSLALLSSCQNKNKEESFLRLTATDVYFDSENKYTTYISDTYNTGIDFSNVKNEDIKIYYVDINTTLDSFKKNDYKTVECTIDSVRTESNNSLEVKFIDSSTNKDYVKSYSVLIRDKYIASLQTSNEDVVLTSSLSSVSSTLNKFNFRINSNMNFSSSFSRNDITLKGSFSSLKITSLVIGVNYFDITLEGNLFLNDDLYLDGIILIDKNGFKNSNEDQSLKINIVNNEIELKEDLVTFKDGECILPIKINNCIDITYLKKEDISLLKKNLVFNELDEFISSSYEELNYEITSLEKEDDLIRVHLKNDTLSEVEFLSSLDQTILKIDDEEILLEFNKASFNMKLIDLEEKNDTFEYLLEADAIDGKFLSTINKDNIEVSSTRQINVKEINYIDENRIRFLLSLKKENNEEIDKTNFIVSVSLKENSMFSAFNKINSNQIEVSKFISSSLKDKKGSLLYEYNEYLNEDLLSYLDEFSSISEFISLDSASKNNYYQSLIKYFAGNSSNDVSSFFETKEEINSVLASLFINLMNEEFSDIENYFSSFLARLNELFSLNVRVEGAISKAINDLELAKPNISSSDNETIKEEKYQSYFSSLSSKINEIYPELKEDLIEVYKEITQKMLINDDFISLFDLLLANISNFDTETYIFKDIYRNFLKFILNLTVNNLIILNGNLDYSSNKENIDLFNYVIAYLDKYEVKKREDDLVYIYSLGEEVKNKMETVLKTESNSSYLNEALIKGDLRKDKDGFVIKYSETGLNFTPFQIKEFIKRLNYKSLTLEEELNLASFEYTKKSIINSQTSYSENFNNFSGYHIDEDKYHSSEIGPFAYDQYLSTWGVGFSSNIYQVILKKYQAIIYRYDVIKFNELNPSLYKNRISSVYEINDGSTLDINNLYVNVFVLK